MTFIAPPAGTLSDQIDLTEHRLTLGLMHPESSTLRIVAWDGQVFRNLTEDAAVKWAQQIESEAYAKVLAPVSDALRTLAAGANEIETSGMFKRAGRAAPTVAR